MSDTVPTGRNGDTTQPFPDVACILPWANPVLDTRGHDPRSEYVELFWLGVLGPSASWLLRRIAARFDAAPGGFETDCGQLAAELGLSVTKGHGSTFARAMHRCVMFGAARTLGAGTPGWEVRRRLATVPARHLGRLPMRIQDLHARWDHSGSTAAAVAAATGASGSR